VEKNKDQISKQNPNACHSTPQHASCSVIHRCETVPEKD